MEGALVKSLSINSNLFLMSMKAQNTKIVITGIAADKPSKKWLQFSTQMLTKHFFSRKSNTSDGP